MPRCKVTGVIVSHIWDDDSSTDYEIKLRKDDQGNSEVWVTQSDTFIALHEESWPEIRDQIQAMMDEIEEDDNQPVPAKRPADPSWD